MAVYKEEKTNTWRAVYRYTDWNGERKQTQKRGFKTKREAQAWEREQVHKTSADLDMNFKSFVELYTADMKTRLKENTWATKEHIIRTKLLPYFGKLKMCNITAQQIITWQNEMLNHKDEKGQPYSPVYLKTVHNQLSAIFNHAVRYYNLRDNPCKKAGSMGKKKNREMMFWTKEQYLKFAEVMMDKPLSFYAFEMLYWCGIREGELLALTPADFDFEKRTVTINKSYQRLNGQDLITTPKTEKSNRVITMPQFLAEEIQDYLKMLYGIGADDRKQITTLQLANQNVCVCAPPMHGKTIWAYYCIQNLFRQRIPVVPLWDVLELRRMMYDYDMGRADSADYYDVKYLFLKIPAEVTHQVRATIATIIDRRVRKGHSTFFIYNGSWNSLTFGDEQGILKGLQGDGSFSSIKVYNYRKKE